MKPNKKIIIPIASALVILVMVYYFAYYRSNHDRQIIKASGQIELTEVDLSFRLTGHVETLKLDEGDRVRQGQVLAELEQPVLRAKADQAAAKVKEIESARNSLNLTIQLKKKMLEADIQRAQAGVSAADARYRTLKTGSREQEIAEAAAARDQAKTTAENRKRDYLRMKDLYDRHIIAFRQFDDAQTAYEAAKSALKAAEERYQLVKIGPREEMVQEGAANLASSDAGLNAAKAGTIEIKKLESDLNTLNAQIAQARAAQAIAEDDLKQSRLIAPFDGFITVKDVEEGEYVQAGTPVLTMARLDMVKVKTYIPETQLGRIQLGQQTEVISDSFPGKTYTGAITYISQEAEFTPKNVQTAEERIKLVYRIRITLANPNQELKGGMPVDVIIK
jgi:HlyD family secretion protein